MIEPRLQRTTVVDGDMSGMPQFEQPTAAERRGLRGALLTLLAGVLAVLALTALPADSPWRAASGALTASDAPLMRAIVALIFLLFLLPSIAYGVAAGTREVASRHRRGHVEVDGEHELLPGAGVLHVAVHRGLRQFEPRRADRARGRRGAAVAGPAAAGDAARHRADHRRSSTCSSARPRPSGRCWRRSSCRC